MSENKREIADRFTEVVARVMDIREQTHEGIFPPHHDYDRWKKRYVGREFSELPVGMIEMNNFRPYVDTIVAQLMMAIDDEQWERGKQPAFPVEEFVASMQSKPNPYSPT